MLEKRVLKISNNKGKYMARLNNKLHKLLKFMKVVPFSQRP
jgi:hypothetical protein